MKIRRGIFVAFAGLLALSACSQTASLPTSTATAAPTLAPSATATPEPPSQPHGLYSDYTLVFDPLQGGWVLQNSGGDVVAAWSSAENAWAYNYDALAKDERINVFDANSFPDKFRDIAYNWLTATDEEWKHYQEFIEACRAQFFEEQNITDEVTALKSINLELESLWGMIYWVQHNREQVIAENMRPVVTPTELQTMLVREPTFIDWSEGIVTTANGKKAYVRYGLGSLGFYEPFEYNSDIYGPILGREDVSVPNRNPTHEVYGNLALMAQPFPDQPDRVVMLYHMQAPPDGITSYKHILFANIARFDGVTIPAGAACFGSRVGEKVSTRVLPKDLQIGAPSHASGQDIPITQQTIMEALGANVYTNHNHGRLDGINILSCVDPETGLEIVTQFNTGQHAEGVDDWLRSWPWQQ